MTHKPHDVGVSKHIGRYSSADLIPAYAKVRSEVLGDVRPAFMLSIVSGLIRPEVLVEVEVIAAAR